MPFNDTALHTMLNALDEITHIGINTLTDPGTGTNLIGGEAAGGTPAYARKAVTWSAPASRQVSNTAQLTFDVAAGTYGFYTLWTADTGNVGVYRGYLPFGGTVKGVASVDTTLTNDQFLSPGHGLVDTDRVMLFNMFGETFPTGPSEGTIYFVVNSAANTFKVSTTSGGAAVDITALGSGEVFFQKVVPETFGAQGQIVPAIGQLVLDLTAL